MKPNLEESLPDDEEGVAQLPENIFSPQPQRMRDTTTSFDMTGSIYIKPGRKIIRHSSDGSDSDHDAEEPNDNEADYGIQDPDEESVREADSKQQIDLSSNSPNR